MPSPYRTREFPLSRLTADGGMRLVRVRCVICRRTYNYFPGDLIQIFGDVDVDSLERRITCEAGDHRPLEVKAFEPAGAEAVGLKIRRLVAIRIQRIPVWREG